MGILEVNNVSYMYKKGVYVLKDICMSFDTGQIHVLLGESGAGKTTLLSLLAGLDVSVSGCICYKGVNLKTINRDRYRAANVGMVFQQFNLIHRLSAIENIVVGLEISNFKPTKSLKQYAEKQLNDVGLYGEKCRRKVIELSGGEQQRVAVARALSHQPEIILADEPTGSLDETNQKAIVASLVAAAKQDNRCVIISTHSPQVAEFADRVYNLKPCEDSYPFPSETVD